MAEIFRTSRRTIDSREKMDYSLKMTNIHWGLFLISIGTMLVEFLIHVNDTDSRGQYFSTQNLFYALFSSLFFILLPIGAIENVKFDDLGGLGSYVMNSAILVAINLGITFLINFSITVIPFNVTPAEYYIFYANTAISEEFVFRGFGITAIRLLFQNFGGEKLGKTFIDINAVLITSLAFMLVHLGIYGENLTLLLSTLFGGLASGFFMIRTNNLLVPVTGHIFNNWVAYFYSQETL